MIAKKQSFMNSQNIFDRILLIQILYVIKITSFHIYLIFNYELIRRQVLVYQKRKKENLKQKCFKIQLFYRIKI